MTDTPWPGTRVAPARASGIPWPGTPVATKPTPSAPPARQPTTRQRLGYDIPPPAPKPRPKPRPEEVIADILTPKPGPSFGNNLSNTSFDPVPGQPGVVAPVDRSEGVVSAGLRSRNEDIVAGRARPLARPELSTTTGGAFGHAAVRNIVPTVGGMAGFGAGFATAGTLSAPLEAVPGIGTLANGIIALLGGLGGAALGSYGAGAAQEAGLDYVPETWKMKIGQDDAQREADAAQHPIATFAGGLAPSLLTMRPGVPFAGVPRAVPAGATRLTRALANPAAAPIIGATVGAGQEAGSEANRGEELDPAKIAISAGAGAVLHKPTRIGSKLFEFGGNSAIASMQKGVGMVATDFNRVADSSVGRAVKARLRSEGIKRARTADVMPEPEAPQAPSARPAPSPTPGPAWPGTPVKVAPVPPAAGTAPAARPAVATQPSSPPPPTPAQPATGDEGGAGLGQAAAPSPAPSPAAPVRPEPGPVGEGERLVRTPAGTSIRTRFGVVDASQLTQAEGANQNRDRSRDTTTLQVQDIISKFDPELLHEDPSTDRGAPIIGPDNAIDSGNGRVLTLNKIYEQHPELAAKYRAMIEARGFSTEGMDRPILVQHRMTEMNPEQRRQFVIDSNKDTKLELSPVERAQSDAGTITPAMLAKYAGGDLNSTANAGFVEAFTKSLTAGEMGNVIGSDRRLTTTGQQRIENAVVAHAYGEPKLLERMMESAHDEIRSITGSLADVAAPWAEMRAQAKAGDIDTSYDITKQLTDAAARVADARKRGIKPADLLSQSDAFDPLDPVTAELIRAFHNPAMTRSASRKAVSAFLQDYITEAKSQDATPGLFGEVELATPLSITKQLLEHRDSPDGAGLALEPAGKEINYDTLGSPEGNARRNGKRNEAQAQADDAESGGSRRAGAVQEGRKGRRDEGTDEDKLDYSVGRSSVAALPNPYDPDFITASFTSRTSLFNSAVEALGMNPDHFRLMPAPRQVALLQTAIKVKFGVEVLVDRGMQERFGIDQMLDAYQNLQGMAHVLDLPSKAISLGGKLKLKLVNKAGFLGAFQPGDDAIILPRRSNSFAHEWGHALDWHLLGDTEQDGGRGLSGMIRKRGEAADTIAPENVREAFVDLVKSMFFDRAAEAAEIMRLEAKIAQSTGVKVKAQAQAQIDRILAGNSQAKGIGTDFLKNAKSFSGGVGSDYWTSPTEMMARAFEAYVSYKVEAAGLTTEFIGKGDAQYLSGAEERFAKTFPKGEEREIIFAAFENLIGLVGDEQMLATGRAADRPAAKPESVTAYDKTPDVKKERGIIKGEILAIKRAVAQKAKEAANRPDDAKGLIGKAADLNGVTFMSMTGNLRMVQARSGSRSLQKLIDLLTKQDGRGDRTVTRTFAEDVHLQSKQAINRLGNILKGHAVEYRTAAEDMLLRDLLTGSQGPDGTWHGPQADLASGVAVPDNYTKAAAKIRHLLDHEFYVNQQADIDLGYTRNGYLARVLDLPKVYHDQPGFLRAASKVYKLVFDKEHGTDPAALLDDEEAMKSLIKLTRFLARGHNIPALPEVQDLLKQIAKLRKQAAGAEDPGPLLARIEALTDEMQDPLAEMFDQTRTAYAAERAEAWLGKINLVAGQEHNASSPDSKYTKHRDLPPEADKIMEKFYLSDPVESVTNYLVTSARRTAYARRFGADGAKRKALFEAMAKEGVSPEDQRTVERILDTATGRMRSSMPSIVQGAFSFVNAAGTMALLPRATISSLAEPFTAALVTGDPLDGFRMIGMMLNGALGSPSGRQRFELARAMGIISDVASDNIMEARYGQTYADSTRWERYTAVMFARTGLTALTRAQKTAGVGLAHAFLDNLAGRIATPGRWVSAEAVAGAVALMRELGIRHPEAFARELIDRGGMPSVEDLDTPFGHDYTTAQLRFSRMVVQEPDAMDRPELAHNPAGRVIYGITAFSYSYWRNIIKRNGILLAEMNKREGTPRAALYGNKLLAGAAIAFLAGLTVSILRERYLNPTRYRQLEDSGELQGTMLKLAFTRTFAFGAADVGIQSYTGLKYQRDLANSFVGAGPGFFLQQIKTLAELNMINSRRTNTAEFNALQGTYSIASPFLAFGLARIPGGSLVEAGTGLGMAAVTSPVARDAFARAIVGPQHGSIGPDGKKIKSGPTALDKRLEAAFPTPKKKKKE